jgi:ATP-dependent helicase/nuclease subunit B
MRVTFLLGPAGCGKTYHCLAGVRAALRADPAGPPLVFLAPKQATFQIERQLLADPDLAGYSRLEILSFERLARFVITRLGISPPAMLSPESRVMVLRALLIRHVGELKLFSQSGSRPGFAAELSAVLAELQQNQFTAAGLRSLTRQTLRGELRDKLIDLAFLLEKYEAWLDGHGLQDVNQLLKIATEALRHATITCDSRLEISALWLDGFAEMTPEEQDLLAAMIPFCGAATLAFCLETDTSEPSRKLSIWSAINKTYTNCRSRLESLSNGPIEVKTLTRNSRRHRFSEAPALAQLESGWARPIQNIPLTIANPGETVRIAECENQEAEATWVAREVVKFVREGHRFRDCAVLFRNLEGAQDAMVRAFRRHQIPFFLDRREPVAHHPLTELTRSALRMVAFEWEHEDWFAALKAGFCAADEPAIDQLENLALEAGWHGTRWLEPLPEEALEKLRQKLLPPFAAFHQTLAQYQFQPTGAQLASAFRELWNDLAVEETLERWTPAEQNLATSHRPPALHATVYEQMQDWVDNLALAFPEAGHRLSEWLPILEAGLAGLTVGVIPPVLDEVLVGAIDRARNPSLKLVVVAGVAETVFPAPPASPPILTQHDRAELAEQKAGFGLDLLQQISREHYLGYIACTRSTAKLLVSYPRQNGDGKNLNPSPFITRLRQIFPELAVEKISSQGDWRKAESIAELIAPLAAALNAGTDPSACPELAGVMPLIKDLAARHEPEPDENLDPAIARRLYGPVLRSSVSRLESFAQCSFRFYIQSGLRAQERKLFELDMRERGSFQHEILKTFHDQLTIEGRRWRDLTPAAARDRINQIARELAPNYRDGLMQLDAQTRFDALVLTHDLEEFVGTLTGWMKDQYQFDPVKAELAFGLDGAPAPSWTLDLPNGHQLALGGKIDRIDLYREGPVAHAVVMDYKSSQKKLDPILIQHGIQLQLLAYLAALRSWPPPVLGAEKIVPAGVFYVNLRGKYESGDSRTEALADPDQARRKAYRHTGRFDAAELPQLDSARAGDQFNYRLTNKGELFRGLKEALPRAEFLKLLDDVESRLKEIAGRIFGGATSVDPYRKGTATACEYCEYRPICRIDDWTHTWRVLRAVEREEEG